MGSTTRASALRLSCVGLWLLATACSAGREAPVREVPAIAGSGSAGAAEALPVSTSGPVENPGRAPIINPVSPPIVTGSADSMRADRPTAQAGARAEPPMLGGSPATQPSATREAFCKNKRPAIRLPKSAAACPGQIASQAFRYALCACNDMLVGGTLSTDGFDSRSNAGMSVEGGGALGVNGSFACSGLLEIGGSVTIAGPTGWAINNLSSGPIKGDLRVAGPMAQDGATNVARNAWLGDALTGLGSLTVTGDLHQSAAAARALPGLSVRGRNLREPVTIDPPCACGEGQVLDIAGIVDVAKSDNDNAAAGFDPDRLAHIVTPRTVELPCGRLYVNELSVESTSATLTIKVTGRTALFVENDVRAVGMVSIEMSPDAELDVFVRGGFVLAGIQSAGNMLKPADLRVYVGGSDGIVLAGITTFTGNLYAPHAMVTVGGIQDLYGAVFAGSFTAGGITAIHYDRAVVREGDDCTPPAEQPPPVCTDCAPPAEQPPPPECHDCTGCAASNACIAGKCGACRNDADCCQPLACLEGTCAPLLF